MVGGKERVKNYIKEGDKGIFLISAMFFLIGQVILEVSVLAEVMRCNVQSAICSVQFYEILFKMARSIHIHDMIYIIFIYLFKDNFLAELQIYSLQNSLQLGKIAVMQIISNVFS